MPAATKTSCYKLEKCHLTFFSTLCCVSPFVEYSLISFDLASLTVSAASASDKKLSHAPKVKHLFDMPEPRQLRLVVNKAVRDHHVLISRSMLTPSTVSDSQYNTTIGM